MTSAAVVIPAVTGAMVQLLQVYFLLSKLNGLTPEQAQELYVAESAKFAEYTPDKLPDA
jgi:hypothetical protein